MEWLRPSDWLLSATTLFILIGAVLLAIVAWWPVPVRFSGEINVFGLDGRASLTMLFGRFAVGTTRTQDGRVDVLIELSLFHFLPIRKRVVGEPAGKAKGGAGRSADGAEESHESPRFQSSALKGGAESEVQIEGVGVLHVWNYAWERWRPVVWGIWRGVQFVLRRVQVKQLQVDGQLGLGDPARTARAYGLLWALFGVLAVLMQKLTTVERQPRMLLAPVYNQWVLRLQGEGTLTIRLGDSFVAGVVALWEYFTKRLSARAPGGRTIPGGRAGKST